MSPEATLWGVAGLVYVLAGIAVGRRVARWLARDQEAAYAAVTFDGGDRLLVGVSALVWPVVFYTALLVGLVALVGRALTAGIGGERP